VKLTQLDFSAPVQFGILHESTDSGQTAVRTAVHFNWHTDECALTLLHVWTSLTIDPARARVEIALCGDSDKCQGDLPAWNTVSRPISHLLDRTLTSNFYIFTAVELHQDAIMGWSFHGHKVSFVDQD
jgi:hypothetical protein